MTGLDAGVQQIAAGADDSCAILIGGDLKCWGDNLYGELGIGTLSPTEETTPTQVASLTSGVDQVTLGFEHSCAIIATPGAEAVCWGNPEHGDIGNGQFGNKAMPFPTAVFSLLPSPTGQGGPDTPVQISAGYYHTCAALSSGAIACWGAGTFGEIGDGTSEDRSIPTRVIGLPATPATSNAVAGGGTAGCALDATLSVKCWGQYVGDGTNAVRTSATTVNNVPAGGIAQVSAGNGGCVLTLKGVVKCWGQNGDGQVGNGTMGSSPVLTPSTVSFPGNPKPYPQALAFSGYHACVTTNDGAGAYCWGANDKGQLGDGTTTNRDAPVAVTALSSGYIAQIAAGGKHTCVLLKNGTVQCWGYNHYGQLGNGSTSDSSTAVTVSGLSDIVQIALGQEFSCRAGRRRQRQLLGGRHPWPTGQRHELEQRHAGRRQWHRRREPRRRHHRRSRSRLCRAPLRQCGLLGRRASRPARRWQLRRRQRDPGHGLLVQLRRRLDLGLVRHWVHHVRAQQQRGGAMLG